MSYMEKGTGTMMLLSNPIPVPVSEGSFPAGTEFWVEVFDLDSKLPCFYLDLPDRRSIFCVLFACSHLGGNDWIVIDGAGKVPNTVLTEVSIKPSVAKSWEILISSDTTSGKLNIRRDNDGFNAAELLGILEMIRDDVMKQVNNEIQPEHVRRLVTDA